MLKNRTFLVLSAVLLFAPAFLTKPANAQIKVQVVAQRDRDSEK